MRTYDRLEPFALRVSSRTHVEPFRSFQHSPQKRPVEFAHVVLYVQLAAAIWGTCRTRPSANVTILSFDVL